MLANTPIVTVSKKYNFDSIPHLKLANWFSPLAFLRISLKVEGLLGIPMDMRFDLAFLGPYLGFSLTRSLVTCKTMPLISVAAWMSACQRCFFMTT